VVAVTAEVVMAAVVAEVMIVVEAEVAATVVEAVAAEDANMKNIKSPCPSDRARAF
jgi:hypothetical protein